MLTHLTDDERVDQVMAALRPLLSEVPTTEEFRLLHNAVSDVAAGLELLLTEVLPALAQQHRLN